MRKETKTLLIFALMPVLAAAAFMPRENQSVRPVPFEDSGWWLYQNEQQGFSFLLPPPLRITITRTRPLDWSAENRMPFDYVNFLPYPQSSAFAPFELGVGVHWNRDLLATREFADRKDDGLIKGGAQFEVIRRSDTLVCGIQGVCDDFRMRQTSGWRSYSRVIIPYQDKFFVFLATLGGDDPVAEHARVFEQILDSFTLQ